MNRKLKVLIVNDQLQYGGSDLVAARLEEHLNKEKFECVYCVRHTEPGPLEATLVERGARIIHIPDEELGYIKSYFYFKRLFKNEHFDIVHSHLMFYSAIVLRAAKKSHIKKRVAHSHFSKPLFPESGLKKLALNSYRYIMRIWLKKYCTDMISCSRQAGEYLFGKEQFTKNGIILNNGIDCSEYEYDKRTRDIVRNEFGINSQTVVLGHIGQMWYAKNHSYLIDIFNEFHKLNENSVLMLVSDGPLRSEIEEKVNSLGLKDFVIFTGFRNDCNRIMMAMDCFVFPSFHEGFPLTLIEAQAAKLPCVVSANVTKETKYNGNVEFLPIDITPKVWADKINELIKQKREEQDNSDIFKNFDISQISKELERIYLAN